MDTEMRELERLALAGDSRAQRKLDLMRSRIDPDRLGSDQERAIAAVQAGKNILLTGAPGTGKSTVIAKIKERFKDKNIAVTASTGHAAFRIGGSTLHRWARIMPDDAEDVLAAKPSTPEEWERAMRQISQRVFFRAESLEAGGFSERMRATNILVLDEISMVDAVTFEIAMRVIEMARREDTSLAQRRPLLQIILSGDFAQLLPVAANTKGLVFEAPYWSKLNLQTVELRELYRSIQDPQLASMLMDLRDGIVTERTVQRLKDQHGIFDPGGEGVVRLVSKRAEAQRINEERLVALEDAPRSYRAVDNGETTLLKDCPAPETLILKKGARVVFTQNGLDEEGQFFANGMVGEVISVQFPIQVRVREGDEETVYRILNRGVWSIYGQDARGNRVVLATRHQYQLALAWAVTLHKSQGATFDKVSVDLSSAWEFGHVYVALSRARRFADLNIESMPAQEINIDERIKPYLHEVPA